MKRFASVVIPYARGIASRNIRPNENSLDVILDEPFATLNGELTTDKGTLDTGGFDVNEEEYSASIKVGYTVPCNWLKEGNRVSRPDIRRGERVIIYRYHDSDKYFWRELGMDQNLRRLETITFLVSANPSNDDQDEPSPENSYMFEISTHTGKMSYSTTMLNGELAAFFGEINPMKGTIKHHDEKSNSFFFDSVNTFLELLNADKTRITVDKKLIDVFAEDSIHWETTDFSIQANNSIVFNATEFFELKTKKTTIESTDTVDIKTDKYTLEAGTSVAVKAGSMINVETQQYQEKCQQYTMQAQSATIQCPSTTITGNVSIGGGLTIAGASTGPTATFGSASMGSISAGTISAGFVAGGKVVGATCC